MSVLEAFKTMTYGKAPEAADAAHAWLDRHGRRFGHFIGGRFTDAKGSRNLSPSTNPATGARARPGGPGQPGRHRCRGRRRPRRPARLAGARRPWPGPLALCHRPPPAEKFAPLRGARNPRQRQADPRNPRHRHPAGRPPFLPSRGLGPAAGRGAARLFAGRGDRPDHPVELPAADAGLENRPGARHGQYRGAQAGRVHPAQRPAFRRPLPRDRPAGRRGQHRQRRRRDRRLPGRPSPGSTRSPSPARPRSAASCARKPPAPARSFRSSWAANRPS